MTSRCDPHHPKRSQPQPIQLRDCDPVTAVTGVCESATLTIEDQAVLHEGDPAQAWWWTAPQGGRGHDLGGVDRTPATTKSARIHSSDHDQQDDADSLPPGGGPKPGPNEREDRPHKLVATTRNKVTRRIVTFQGRNR